MKSIKEYYTLNEAFPTSVISGVFGSKNSREHSEKQKEIIKKIFSLMKAQGFTFQNQKYKEPVLINGYPFLDCYRKFSDTGLVFITYNNGEFKFRIFGGKEKYVDTYFTSKEGELMISAIKAASSLIIDLNYYKKEIIKNLPSI